ncbi:MAG: hypothetical protein AAFR54_22065, partial [Planctomycetota bacterium]
MIKTLVLLGTGAALAALGLTSPIGPSSAPTAECAGAGDFTYVEARDTTVWGGACHVSGEAACFGRRAACAFDFGDARVVLSVLGDRNLQGQDVFRAGGAAQMKVEAWVDGADPEAALALAYAQIPDLPAPVQVHRAPVAFAVDGEGFSVR